MSLDEIVGPVVDIDDAPYAGGGGNLIQDARWNFYQAEGSRWVISGAEWAIETVTVDTAEKRGPYRAKLTPAGVIRARALFGTEAIDSWPDAEVGGAWAGDGVGFDSDSVSGKLTFTAANQELAAELSAATTTQTTDSLVRCWLDALPVGDTFYHRVRLRRLGGATSYYYADLGWKADSTLIINIGKVVAGTPTVISSAVAAGSYALGDVFWLRFQAEGGSPTTLRVRTWKEGTVEPTTWLASPTDSEASLQAAGYYGLGGLTGAAMTNAAGFLAYADDFSARTTIFTPSTLTSDFMNVGTQQIYTLALLQRVTANAGRFFVNVARTTESAASLTVQRPVPRQAPVQPAKR